MSISFKDTKQIITDSKQLQREIDIRRFFLECLDDSQAIHHRIVAEFPKEVFKFDFHKTIDYVEVVPYKYNGGIISAVQLQQFNQYIRGFATVEREDDESQVAQSYVMFTYDPIHKTFARENYRINERNNVEHTKRFMAKNCTEIEYAFSDEADDNLECFFTDNLYFREHILPKYLQATKRV